MERIEGAVTAAGASPAQQQLREELTRFRIDEPTGRGREPGPGQPSLSFEARLARDNGWSAGYTQRVMEEYRRFLFLGQVAGHPVTPSDEVDQAWHLHLTYTRSYWDDLCANVLGRPFHHGPTRGGAAEGAKFTDWYERTKASYRTWFGAEPPADIWPSSEERFGLADTWIRVNTRRHLVVAKPDLAGGARRSALVAGGSLALAGCSGAGVLGLLAQDSSFRPTILIAAGIVVAIIALLVYAGNRPRSRRRRSSDQDGDVASAGFWAWFTTRQDDGSGGGCGGGFFGGGGDDGGGGGGCGGGGCGGGGCGS